MKNKLYIIYFICLCLYFMQGGLYEHGSIIPRIVLLVVLSFDVYYAWRVFKFNHIEKVGKGIVLFLLIWTISWAASPKTLVIEGMQISTLGELKNSYLVLLSYFPFCVWGRQGLIDSERMKMMVPIIFFCISLAFAFILEETLLAQYWKDDVTNNAGYFLVMIVPLFGFIYEKKYVWALLFISILLVLFSTKRGAILCVACEALLFVKYKWSSIKKSNVAKIGIVIVVAGFFVYFYKYINNNSFLLDRFNSDSSGRDIIYRNAINVFQEGDLFNKLFGYGFLNTIEKMGIYAHNDWLEMLVDVGLLGVFLLFYLIVQLFSAYVKIRKSLEDKYRFIFGAAFIVFLIRTAISQCIFAPEVCFLIIAMSIMLNSDYASTRNIQN